MNRKLRKLVRNPSAFTRDLVANRLDAVRRRFRRGPRARYSVVAAVYGVERYLDEFFQSLTQQTIWSEGRIELIMVDDGSPDRSADVIARWQREHPDAIRLVRKENGGQASARNVGLDHATGDWVTFIDPDDVVDPRYFERVDRMLERPDAARVVMLACKLVFWRAGKTFDTHPLRSQFAGGDRVVPMGVDATHVQLSAASAFFRRDLLARTGRRFDEEIRPTFEDGHFVARYLLENPGDIGICAKARYLYRKREDASSTLDRSWSSPDRFGTVLARGYLDVLRASAHAAGGGPHPKWVQRTILYELVWYVRTLLDAPETIDFLTEAQRDQLQRLMRETLEQIDDDVVVEFDLAGAWLFHKIGILGVFKGTRPAFQHVYVQEWDSEKEHLQLAHYFHGEAPLERFLVDGVEIFPAFAKTRRHRLFGASFVEERIVWLPLRGRTGHLQVVVGDAETRMVVKGRVRRDGVALGELVRARPAPDARRLPPRDRIEHALATTALAERRYRDAFVFMDRDTQADDNAEHLYRYVRRERPEINAFFVLRRDSHDWDRLHREGFRLLAYGSLEHRVALLHAKHIISSHADHYVVSHPGGPELTRCLRAKFTFLQHGVTANDLSSWLNGKRIDCFVTASPAEHASIVESGGPYKFTDREVVLSGFPRHDALGANGPPPQRVLAIMPTWRRSLVGETTGAGNERRLNPAFYESQYAKTWRSLLHSSELRDLASVHGYRVLFFPHANIQPYLDWFAPPAPIETMAHRPERSIQELFRSASIMLTDYSSTAFEMAYLRKAVLYYQFDRELVFGGGHLTRRGYFDTERDGFGPVCQDEASLLEALATLMRDGGKPSPEHLARMERTFAFRDGRSCERTLEAILELDRPTHSRDRSSDLLVEAAREATRHRAWAQADRRWTQVLELPRESQPADAELRLVEAKRERGHVDEADELLAAMEARREPMPEARRERAELATKCEDWKRAAALWGEVCENSRGDERGIACVRRAEALRRLGDLTAARAALDDLPPDHDLVDARVERAEIATAEGSWTSAARQWEALTADAAAPPRCWVRLAEVLLRIGSHHRALEATAAYLAKPGGPDEQRARVLRVEILTALRELGEPSTETSDTIALDVVLTDGARGERS